MCYISAEYSDYGILLNECFRTMYLKGMINKNSTENVEMIKKANENPKLTQRSI